MTFKNWVLMGFTIGMLFSLSGCNNSKSSSAPPPAPCPAGQVATPAGCTPPGNVTPPIGYIPPTGNGIVQYFASKSDYLIQTDSLIPTSNYVNFLRDALGVCDRCQTTVGQGLECESWMAGFNMLMISVAANQSNLSQMAFYSTPLIAQTYFNYAWQFPSIEDFFLSLFTGVPPPTCNPGQFTPYWATSVQYEPTNNNQGFVLYVNYGPSLSRWNLYKFRLIVPVGKIGDPKFNFQLSVIDKNGNSADLATGTLNRCQSLNCSMF